MTYKPSAWNLEDLMSSAEDSPAKISHMQEKEQDSQDTEADSGSKCAGSSTKQNRRGSSQKTSQPFVLEDWNKSLGHSLRSGIMHNGTVYPLPPLVRLTRETGSGLWPTPTTNETTHKNMVLTEDGRRAPTKGKTSHSIGLADAVRIWATPTANQSIRCSMDAAKKEAERLHPKGRYTLATQVACDPQSWPTASSRDWKDTPGMKKQSGERNRTDQLPRKVYAVENTPPGGGYLNPLWVEWLMGYPIGWTELNPSETP